MLVVLLKDPSDSGHWEENEGWFLEGGQVWSGLHLLRATLGCCCLKVKQRSYFFKCKSYLTLIV